MYWKYFCCTISIRIAYKWHHSRISLCISKTGTTQTAGARNKGGNFIGQLCISVVPHCNYGGIEVTCVFLSISCARLSTWHKGGMCMTKSRYLSRAHEILCRTHDLVTRAYNIVSRAHELSISCTRIKFLDLVIHMSPLCHRSKLFNNLYIQDTF